MDLKRKKKEGKKSLILEGEDSEFALKPPFFEYRKRKKYRADKKPEVSNKTHPPITQRKKAISQKKPPKTNKKKKRKSKILQEEIQINPGYYQDISLGNLKRGTKISIECSELEGNNFTFFILDKTNYQKYKQDNRAPKSFMEGRDEDEYEDKRTIQIDSEYTLIITSRAQSYSRLVWYRLKIDAP